MKKAFTILVGFVHDFAAGIWLATVLAMYWLKRHEVAYGDIFFGLKKQFFYLGLACVALVFLAGMGRTFVYAYIGDVYGAEAEKLRRKMLIIKHTLLLLVFATGIYWQWTMVFK